MICPNCKKEIKDGAKFCTKCGAGIAAAGSAEPSAPVCTKCGARLKAGAKFCTKCGTPTVVEPPKMEPKPEPKPMPKMEPPKAEPKPEPKPMPKMESPKAEPKAEPKPVPKMEPPKAEPKPEPKQEEKSGSGGVVVLIVLLVLAVAVGTVGVLMWRDVIPVPQFGAEKSVGVEATAESEKAGSEETQTIAEKQETEEEQEEQEEENAELTNKINEIKGSITATENDAIEYKEQLENALDLLLDLAEVYGNNYGIGDATFEVYGLYADHITYLVGNCNKQPELPGLYNQMNEYLDGALEYAARMSSYGIGASDAITSLESLQDEIKSGYKDRLIQEFDNAAEDDIEKGYVSGITLWKIVDGIKETDLYDEGNLADPLSLRYECAQAIYIKEQMEEKNFSEDCIDLVYDFFGNESEYFCPLLAYLMYSKGLDAGGIEYSKRFYNCISEGDATPEIWYLEYQNLDLSFSDLSLNAKTVYIYNYYVSGEYQTIREAYRDYMYYKFRTE